MNRQLPTVVLMSALVVVGCSGKAPTLPKGSKAPVGVASAGLPPSTTLQVSQVGDAATLTGKVKIVSDNGGGIISDNGSGIISDNGGGVISNNSGNIIANNGSGIIGNNGGAIISNDGGGLTGKVKYPLLAVSARELLLADATISFYDAAGRQLQDEAGKPITVTTDQQGNYQLKAVLPPGNLVMKIQVHEGGLLKGGELSAMLVREGSRVVDTVIDTSSSLGAAYVLSKYVGGDQKTFDKLPASEAERLRRALDLAGPQLSALPDYHLAQLVAAMEGLRAKAPGVDKTLKDIQALLLGQANLGNGLQATDVALFRPNGIALEPDGGIVITEPLFGRVRRVGPDGTLTTIADVLHGTLKRNFVRMRDLKRGPDGSLYVLDVNVVYRIAPDGKTVETVAGGPELSTAPLPGSALDVKMDPNRMALGPDGTLYIGEEALGAAPARVIAVAPGGQARQVDLPGFTPQPGWFSGIQVTADGTMYFLWAPQASARYQVLRLKPGAQVEVLAKDLDPAAGVSDSGMLVGPDGTVYVAEQGYGRVTAIAPDGKRRIVAGKGGPAGYTDLLGPSALALDAQGTLYVVDAQTSLVHALTADGRWFVRAGTRKHSTAQAGGQRGVSLNAPEGGFFDERGNLIISEYGAGLLQRFDGADLAPVAGSVEGDSGDGGPALAASLRGPTGVATYNGEIYFIDGGNHRIRAVGKDGLIRTVVGSAASDQRTLEPGQRVDAKAFAVDGNGLAFDKQGRLYWTGTQSQVFRLAADGKVELAAGKAHSSNLGVDNPANIVGLLDPKLGDGGPATAATFVYPTGLAFDAKGDMYVADTGGMRIRKVTGLDGDAPTISTFAGISFQEMLAVADQDPLNIPPGTKANETVVFAPGGLVFAPDGTLYVGELGTLAIPLLGALGGSQLDALTRGLPPLTARIRKIAPDGTITTVAGPGAKLYPDGYREDSLVLPAALTLSADGRLAIVDAGANTVRILPAGSF